MAIITRKVKGVEYIYFSRFDRASAQKTDIYCGRADSPEAQEKARRLEAQYVAKRSKDARKRGMNFASWAHIILEELAAEILNQGKKWNLTMKRNQKVKLMNFDYVISKGTGKAHLVDVRFVSTPPSLRIALGVIAMRAIMSDPVLTVIIFVGRAAKSFNQTVREIESELGKVENIRGDSLFVIPDNPEPRILVDSVDSIDAVTSDYIATLARRILSAIK